MYRNIERVAEDITYCNDDVFGDSDKMGVLKTYKAYIDDPATLNTWDEDLLKTVLYDEIITEGQADVIEAVSTRRKHQIPYVIETFNKTIGQRVPQYFTKSLSAPAQAEKVDASDCPPVDQTLTRYSYLLQD